MTQSTPLDNNAVTVKNYSGNAGKILDMLGSGFTPAVVASAIGVSESYISQLLSEEEFSSQVTAKRFTTLQASTTRDRNYDKIEDALIKKMEDLLPMMYKPMEVLRAITIINSAKRRGADAPDSTTVHNTIVQLTLPTVITSRFVTNVHNQVIEAGEQELITIETKNLTSRLEALKPKVLTNDLSSPKAVAATDSR